jgi:hypothetical protein
VGTKKDVRIGVALMAELHSPSWARAAVEVTPPAIVRQSDSVSATIMCPLFGVTLKSISLCPLKIHWYNCKLVPLLMSPLMMSRQKEGFLFQRTKPELPFFG